MHSCASALVRGLHVMQVMQGLKNTRKAENTMEDLRIT